MQKISSWPNQQNLSHSHVDLTTPVTNKIGPLNDCRSLYILAKPASNIAYKDRKVARDKKRSQYLKSSYVDPDKLRKRVGIKTEIESEYYAFKKNSNL